MTINIMLNNSEDAKINKNITTIASLSGTLKNETSIMNPTILMEGNVSSIAGCNYMYIPEFGRYYFITDVRSIRNKLYEIS